MPSQHKPMDTWFMAACMLTADKLLLGAFWALPASTALAA
jgi:hypothetical protein